MNERYALITGAARRVGRHVALRLADAGYHVAFTFHRSGSDANSLVQEIGARGRRALAIQADLTCPEEAARSIHDRVIQAFPALDVLINNASIYKPSSLHDAPEKLRNELWAIHVEAPFLLARHFRANFTANGCIINMLDLLGERPWPDYLYYCATKAALLSLTRGLAREMAPHVTVNGIAPGVVAWPDDYPESERRKYLSRVPLKRAGAPDDVANAVLFLLNGGGYLTGEIIHLDGGRSIT